MIKKVYRMTFGFLVLFFTLSPNVFADISSHKGVLEFIDEMVEDHKFDRAELINLFKQVEIEQKIIDAITRPAESKPWHDYRPIFLTQDRISGGVKFWQEHEKDLQRAYEQYGVPPEIIVAIIGVESKYGKYKGSYPIVVSLSTLAFEYPKRAKFFRKQLVEYLLIAREENIDPLSWKGSYAGAMGKPQFIPSSFRHFAVDFDGDGKRDLINSSVDAIGSVANYFKEHNWIKGDPITTRAVLKGKKWRKILKEGIRPTKTLEELKSHGISTKAKIPSTEKAALFELELKKGKRYWLGYNNFYTITRYNHSELYAMAVYLLSKNIARNYKPASASIPASTNHNIVSTNGQ